MMHASLRTCVRHPLALACLAFGGALLLTSHAAPAATGRSFIAPHEYALPGNVPDGFDVFLVYGYLERADERYDAHGDAIASDRGETLVSLFKYSQGWTLASNPNFGYAWEVILPISSARNRTIGTSASGIGDPIVAPYVWYKLSEKVTIGTDLLIGVPMGDSEVGGSDAWKLTHSVFMDVQMGDFNYTGDVIWNYPGISNAADTRAGRSWSTEHLFSWRSSERLEPYVGFAYEHQQSSPLNLANSETDLLAGMLLHLRKTTAAVHWTQAVDGKNRPDSHSINFRLVWSL